MLIQRKLLHDDDVEDYYGEFETWNTAHVLGEHTNPTTKVKMLTIRFEEGG